MPSGLDAIARYNELYSEYLKDMQKPKYSANPDGANTDDLLRDLYKVVCGNGNARKSILHWSVDNGARLTIASEDMHAIQATLAEHSARLKAQEDTCLENRSIHFPKAVAAVAAQPVHQPAPAATVVNVSSAPSAPTVKSQSAFIGFVQTVKNIKDIVNMAVILTTAIIVIISVVGKTPAPVVTKLNTEETAAIVKAILAQQAPVAKP